MADKTENKPGFVARAKLGKGVVATLGLEEADSKMHVQRTGSGYEAVQTDVGAKIPNVQYSYRSLRRRSDGQAGKKYVMTWNPPSSQLERSWSN